MRVNCTYVLLHTHIPINRAPFALNYICKYFQLLLIACLLVPCQLPFFGNDISGCSRKKSECFEVEARVESEGLVKTRLRYTELAEDWTHEERRMKAKTPVRLRRTRFGDGIVMDLPLRYSRCAVLVSLAFCSLQCRDMVTPGCDHNIGGDSSTVDSD